MQSPFNQKIVVKKQCSELVLVSIKLIHVTTACSAVKLSAPSIGLVDRYKSIQSYDCHLLVVDIYW